MCSHQTCGTTETTIGPTHTGPLAPGILCYLCATLGIWASFVSLIIVTHPRCTRSHFSLGTGYLPGIRTRLPVDQGPPLPRNSIFAPRYYLYLQKDFFLSFLCKPSDFRSNCLGFREMKVRKLCLLLPFALHQIFLKLSELRADPLLECEEYRGTNWGVVWGRVLTTLKSQNITSSYIVKR